MQYFGFYFLQIQFNTNSKLSFFNYTPFTNVKLKFRSVRNGEKAEKKKQKNSSSKTFLINPSGSGTCNGLSSVLLPRPKKKGKKILTCRRFDSRYSLPRRSTLLFFTPTSIHPRTFLILLTGMSFFFNPPRVTRAVSRSARERNDGLVSFFFFLYSRSRSPNLLLKFISYIHYAVLRAKLV